MFQTGKNQIENNPYPFYKIQKNESICYLRFIPIRVL